MARRPSPYPTEAELEILRLLWHRGPSTVRQVLEQLNQLRPTGYTTALKNMQMMHEKGLLSRNEEKSAHVYRAAVQEEETQEQILGHLLTKVFSGSTKQMVLRALSTQKVTPEELQEIQEMIGQIKEEKS